MRFPVKIDLSGLFKYTATVPGVKDFTYSADTLDGIEAALTAKLKENLENGIELPTPTPIGVLFNEESKQYAWTHVTIDVLKLYDSIDKINVSMDKELLSRIDIFISQNRRSFSTRSSFLAEAATLLLNIHDVQGTRSIKGSK